MVRAMYNTKSMVQGRGVALSLINTFLTAFAFRGHYFLVAAECIAMSVSPVG